MDRRGAGHEDHPHYERVRQAIEWLATHQASQPSLDQLAQALNLSPWHLQRIFSEWAGVSPKQFLQFLTRNTARARLRAQQTVEEAAWASGLSGSGRLHDLMVKWEAMTPGEIRAGGRGVKLCHGWADSPFGPVLIAWTDRGLCHLAFADAPSETEIAALESLWPRAGFVRDEAGARQWSLQIFSPTRKGPLKVLLRGSAFQLKVWEALLSIPPGEVWSYQQLAMAVGQPGASRAVGSALARNLVGYVIPCHRVIRATGETGQYRWGTVRKQAIQMWESAQMSTLLAEPADGDLAH
ncbi:MAG: methylated-DNA--[protein]-cysteine S-methyltransferase [Gammaproteobacteria bacterium]|nr:MAG: methylated-DNA--[protein]-cysteine S-methyltransferase [Gammaproteobacteria bacterium]